MVDGSLHRPIAPRRRWRSRAILRSTAIERQPGGNPGSLAVRARLERQRAGETGDALAHPEKSMRGGPLQRFRRDADTVILDGQHDAGPGLGKPYFDLRGTRMAC